MFAFAVGRARIIPELLRVRRHHEQVLADGIVQDELVLLSPAQLMWRTGAEVAGRGHVPNGVGG